MFSTDGVVREVGVFKHNDMNYLADASDLFWAPGHFPESAPTTLGDKTDFKRFSLTRNFACYKQESTGIMLKVFND